MSTYSPFGSGKGIGRWHPEDGISSYTVEDGLLDNRITDLLEDRHGNLWIATQRGLSCFDGVVFRNFTTEDGLPCNRIHWQPATREMRAYYRDLSPGDYTFQVRAVDRDLNYSEIAQVQLLVETDPRISALTSVLNSTDGVGKEFIGQSAAMHQFQIRLMEVASTDLTVLILGETGVGKGVAARVLHALSPHCDGPFIQVNCGALPATLIDSELFGHEKGAFTSAVSRKLGKVELAKGGTFFLDEIGDMAPKTQIRMLRLLEERTFERVGGNQTLPVQARIVAATNRNLEEMVSAGTFREDLYYRFQVFPIQLPPLRERREDIPHLSEFFKSRIATHLGKQIGGLTPRCYRGVTSLRLPGKCAGTGACHTTSGHCVPRFSNRSAGSRTIWFPYGS